MSFVSNFDRFSLTITRWLTHVNEATRTSRKLHHPTGRDQLLAWVAELEQTGIHLQILQLGVDTSTPAGKMVLTVIAALAEMERAVLVGRVREGLASAKLRGRVGGRPASLSPAQRAEVVRFRADGRSAGECAELFGVSTRSIRRVAAAGRLA